MQTDITGEWLFFYYLSSAAGRFEVAEWIAGIVVVVRVSIAMLQEKFHSLNRNGEPEAFTKCNFHVGHAYDFAAQIEKGAATVSGVDLRCGLQIKIALHLAGLGAHDSFGDSAFEAKRTANGENAFTHRENFGVAERNTCKLRRIFVFNFKQG